jgi:hypothetical protein
MRVAQSLIWVDLRGMLGHRPSMSNERNDRAQVRAARHEANRLAADLTPPEEACYPEELAEAIRQIDALAAKLDKGSERDRRAASALRSLSFGIHRDHAVELARRRARGT